MQHERTRAFFDEMARRYDIELETLGWDPVGVVTDWPLVIPPGARVLDAGCGTGALLERFAGADRDLAGFDLSETMLRHAKQRRALKPIPLDVVSVDQEWPYLDGSFDIVVCLAVLEFVPEPDRALDELARVLREGGRALVSFDDILDWDENLRPAHEVRYDEIPLWRWTADEIALFIPPQLDIVRLGRIRAYHEPELGVTAAYHVLELVRNDRA